MSFSEKSTRLERLLAMIKERRKQNKISKRIFFHTIDPITRASTRVFEVHTEMCSSSRNTYLPFSSHKFSLMLIIYKLRS